MGDYYAIATRFKLKKDTPKTIESFFDVLYGAGGQSRDIELRSNVFSEQLTSIGIDIDSLASSVRLVSLCHDAHCVRGKENDVYYSFASTKYPRKELYQKLFTQILDYLDVSQGDVLYTQVWEDSSVEVFLYVDPSLEAISCAEAKLYKYEDGYMLDDTHPYNLEKGVDKPKMKINNFFDLV
jgi:hypothetical protein